MAATSTPGTDGQAVVYAGASRGSVYAIDALSGSVQWRGRFLPDSAAVAYSPVYHDGAVFAEFNVQVATGPDSGGVVALDATTGAVLWLRYFPRTDPNNSPIGRNRVAIAGDIVVAPSTDGIVYAFERATGNLAWQTPRQDLERLVAAHGSTVFVGSVSSTTVLDGMPVIAFDAATGRELWRFVQGSTVREVVADSLGLHVAVPGYLITLDAGSGRELWRVGRLSDGSRSILGGPAPDGSSVYAAATDGFYAFRR
jgi:outer membrane protein assembly factor BamB